VKPSAPARGGPDRWLLSYADFMTLLFAFFTTLYAISTVDQQKLAPLASSLQAAFDGVPAGKPTIVPTAALVPPATVAVSAPDIDTVQRQLEAALADAIAAGRLEIVRDARGLVLSLPDDAMFETGRADVTVPARDVIGRIAATLGPLPHDVRIEGHTDDVPIRTVRYASNWELSTARASAVVAFLIEQSGITPGRLSAAGYGEFHPRVANDTAANRRHNRRVDIVVLMSSEAAPQTPGLVGGADGSAARAPGADSGRTE
jgi:chemotaxis protein MotB